MPVNTVGSTLHSTFGVYLESIGKVDKMQVYLGSYEFLY